MTTIRRNFLLNIYVLSDLSLLGLSLYAAVFRQDAIRPLSVIAEKPIQVHTVVAMVVLFFTWKTTFHLMGLYQSKRLIKHSVEATQVFTVSIIATLLLSVVAFLFHSLTITPGVLWRFFCLASIGLVGSHAVMRQGLEAVRLRGHNLRHLLIVGTNDRALAFANSILARPELGYKLVGFVDDSWTGLSHEIDLPAALVCDLNGFRSFLRTHVVDEVVIALPIKSFYEQEDELFQICGEQGIVVRMLPDLFRTSPALTGIDQLGSSLVFSFYTTPNDVFQLAIKRLFDLAGSMILLVLLSPVLLATFILVKLDSKGPAIFVQERVGLNKRRFHIYKFRSMVTNSEKLQAQLESANEAQGPVFKIKRDPRITKIGRFMRKTSIDELPQLFNVLKGDMSLVGPRPLPIRDYNGFSEDWQRRRFSIRPGITCLWQVSGRNGISFDQWMRLDMTYIDQWSIWLDLKILARTIPAVVRGSGAV